MDWKSATVKEDGTVIIPERWLHLHYYEALNILFRMENALRVFVYIVLKGRFKDKWIDTPLQTAEDEQSTISAIAAKRLTQAKGFGYLGYSINSPLMYLNSGELTRVITSDKHWELFRPFFRGKRDIIRTKLDEIGVIRNALAHFRPLKYDDIELIKQNVKHVFAGIEQCLSEMTETRRVVPTNTEGDWYKNLTTLGSSLCTVRLYQDGAEKWLRVELNYACAVLRNAAPGDYRAFTVSNLDSPAIIARLPLLSRHCTFLAEDIPYVDVTHDNCPNFVKKVSLVFARNAILENYQEICDQLRDLLLTIDTETELLRKDNLARGALIDSAHIMSVRRRIVDDEDSWWSVDTNRLRSELGENSPSEYWGNLGLQTGDFIAGSTKYPWMPSDISKEEFPF